MTREEFDAHNRDFYDCVLENYGARGMRQAKLMMDDAFRFVCESGLPLENSMSAAAGMCRAFIMNKERAREKFTPMKYRKTKKISMTNGGPRML